MRTPSTPVLLLAVGLLLAGCGDDAPSTDEPAAVDEAQTDPAETADGADTATEDEAPADGAAAAGGTGAVVTLGGETYEVTEVRDCTVDDPLAPNDRLFNGVSADGSVEVDISYFEDESLSGLNGLSLTVGDDDWVSSIVGADRVFTIEQRPDGADGTAEVGKQGGGAEPVIAAWSFTC